MASSFSRSALVINGRQSTCVFVASHPASVWTFVVVEGSFVVACIGQHGEVFTIAESHEAGFFTVDFLFNYDGSVLEVGHKMVKQLFPR